MVIAVFVILFAIFPLTDTDIWWHLACAREWVTTWTPVRTPVVNVHEYFQLAVGFVYGLGGAPLLVAFKAILWGVVFALFLLPENPKCHCEVRRTAAISSCMRRSLVAVVLLFVFRYHFEMRPVLFSLLFLGIYWNVLPRLFANSRLTPVNTLFAVLILAIQWTWCKTQGLYILGPLFAVLVLTAGIWNSRKSGDKFSRKAFALRGAFVVALFAMPFLHREGLALFLYPFGLLDRLLGLSPSAAIFASEIAENRSPFTLLMEGENTLECVLMILLCLAGMGLAIWRLYKNRRPGVLNVSLLATAILVLIAERNFVLFLPVLLATLPNFPFHTPHFTSCRLLSTVYFLLPTFFIFGLWVRSLSAYDISMVAYQRVPVDATDWMQKHPHKGKLFNDDRAGGYLALMNPTDSIYIDGRFILKTADFFERYLNYAKDPALFMHDADSIGIDRALFPLQYYARWDTLLRALQQDSRWHLAYRDEYFAVFDKMIK
ncbi:hypothetical protein SAMN05720470_101134 [Fibrobacter sp. UWOV1]|uniref:hypothetical protein n=1 Tax=Fibrobacter sp. UWOV1 TaxID=1896215 RepID=UPI00091640EE|nr:hypothetical protein [Fibrobacter sp. UWOV1]SHK32569.1 hypothetical protein SAMN05720470_101134 [Fibrobacter sp. UWOV1]